MGTLSKLTPFTFVRTANIAVLVLGTIQLLCRTSVCQADITNGLVRHWKLNETSGSTATDSSGYGYNGTYTNWPTLNQSGKCKTSVSLDGYNDYVDLPTSVVNGLTDCTISVWVNLDTVGTWSRIFDFGSSTSSYMFLTPKNSYTNRLRFAITTSGTGGEQVIDTTTTITTGTWYHVAVRFNGSVATIYVNGVQVGQNSSMTLTPSSLGASWNNYFGRSQYSADPYLDGRLDDFRIYNRALSASEIGELYGLQLHWKLDEGSGTTLADSSAYERDGAFNTGAPSWVSGQRNGAIQFNGSNDADTNSTFDPPAKGTVAFWYRFNAAPTGTERLFGLGDNWECRSDSSGTLTFDLGQSNGVFTTPSGVCEADVWHHVVAVYNDATDTYKVYLDAQLVNSGSTSISDQVAAVLSIGIRTGSSERFNGALDDFRVYNYELSEAEIAEVYGLIAHWKLDEASGTTAADSSLANNDATLTGTQGWTSGQDGGGHNFNYSNGEEYFTAPSNTALNDVQENDYTVMAYFKPNSVPPGSGSDNDSQYTIVAKSGYHLGIFYNNVGEFQVEHWLTGDTWIGAGTWGQSYSPGQFHHVAGVVSHTNGTVKIYVDGVLKNTATFTAGTAARDYGTARWRIGMGYPGGGSWGYPCDGVIDDARIYNRALSDEEIAAFATSGMLAHWTFDEAAGTAIADSSSYGHDAAFNTGTPTWTSGVRDGALQFNGSNDADTNTSFDPPAVGSVAFWMRRTTAATGNERLFGLGGDWEVRTDSTGVVVFDLSGSGGGAFQTAAPLSLLNRWYHVVAIYNSSTDTYSVYVNGEFNTFGTLALTDQSAAVLSFGTRTGSTERYNGALDDLRIYNYELSATEIAELYGLTGHWAFDEGSGSTAADSTAYGNDATLSGATWISDCAGNVALQFDGTDDMASTGANFDPPAEGSVAFWFRSGGTPAARQRPWGLGNNFEVRQETDGLMSFDIGATGDAGGFVTTESIDDEDHWYHFVSSYDTSDDSYAIYINGELHKSGISSIDLTEETANILSFGVRTGTTDYWEGALRDFRIYNRFLQDFEIAELSAVAGHWRLDETSGSVAVDESVLSTDGSHVNLPTLGVSSAYAPENGTAVEYDGSSDYTTIPHDDAMLADNGTVMFWFRTSALTADQGLFSKDSANYDTGGHLNISLTGGKVHVSLESTTQSYLVESPVVAANKWRHVAFTWGVTGMNLYVDGQLVDSSLSYTGGLGTTSGGAGNYEPIVLGADASASGDLSVTPLQNYLQGALDDVRFYARAVCSDEVYRIYRSGRGPGARIVEWIEVR